MTTDAVTSLLNVSRTNETDETKKEDSTLGKEAFLKLLVAQMSNQDPLSPMDNKDMILQLAQLSAIEGTQNLNDNFSNFVNTSNLATATNMIGKNIVYQDSTTGYDVVGKVSMVDVTGSSMAMVVDGVPISMSQIKMVLPDDATTTQE